MILARACEVFNRFTKVPAMRFDAAFARGPNEREREAGVESHCDQGRFPESRDSFDADVFPSPGRIGFEIVERARCPPRPSAQSSPIFWFAGLSLIRQADDASGE